VSEEKRYVRYGQNIAGDWCQMSEGPLMGVPNVDALNFEELHELEYALRTLHHVVRNKARALEVRSDGYGELADKIEAIAEKHKAALPEAYRW
jgi:uncharacterized Fe-S cluster-containing radical SAM superfamily enzyme